MNKYGDVVKIEDAQTLNILLEKIRKKILQQTYIQCAKIIHTA